MTEPERRPRPRAFRLDGDTVVPPKTAREAQEQARPFATKVIEPEEDPFASRRAGAEGDLEAAELAVEEAQAGDFCAASSLLGRRVSIAMIFVGEALNFAALMLPNSNVEVVGHSDVESARAAGDDVDPVLLRTRHGIPLSS